MWSKIQNKERITKYEGISRNMIENKLMKASKNFEGKMKC